MNSMRSIVRTSSTATLCLVCGMLALFWPDWRTTLRAESYYHEHGHEHEHEHEGQCMAGGGSVGSAQVTHSFVLHCNVDRGRNTLEVSWGRKNKFSLEHLTSASCTHDPNIPSNPERAGFDTYDGTGTGRYNGAPAAAEWTFTDAGRQGANDFADIVITDSTGNVLSVSGILSKGHQHAKHNDCEGDQHESDDARDHGKSDGKSDGRRSGH